MAEKKFHINSKQEVAVCRANVKPCRFGGDAHFSSREAAEAEAEKRLKKEHSSLLRSMKKEEKSLPATVNLSLLREKDAAPEKKADVLLFEAMKRDDSFSLGMKENSRSSYYSPIATFSLDEETTTKLLAHGVGMTPGKPKKFDEKKALQELTSLELVPGTLTSGTKNYFNGTGEYSGEAHYLYARAVATFPDGGRMVLPVGAAGGFNDFLNATIDIADEERAGRNAERVLEAKAQEQARQEEAHDRIADERNSNRGYEEEAEDLTDPLEEEEEEE